MSAGKDAIAAIAAAEEGMRTLKEEVPAAIRRIVDFLAEEYLKKAINVPKVSNALLTMLASERVIHCPRIVRPSKTSKAVIVTFLFGKMSPSDGDDFLVRAGYFWLGKRSCTLLEQSAFVQVWRHAFERTIQRSGVSFSEASESLISKSIISQSFLSIYCQRTYDRSVFCFPAHDGLFLGQTEVDKASPAWAAKIKSGRIDQFEPTIPNIGILLGNPPRRMKLKTYIGPNDLHLDQRMVLSRMSNTIHGHLDTISDFGEAVLFRTGSMQIGFDEAVHAVSVGVQEFFDAALGQEAADADELLIPFRDERNRERFRAFLAEYHALLATDEMKSIIEHGRKHLS